MKVYVDAESKFHVTNDGTMTAVETDFFDGKCDTFIEGYRFDPTDEKIEPWKDFDELEAAQKQYEADMAELQAAYQEGVNSAYD